MAQQINLYNPVFLKQKHYFSALTMAQALAAVLVGSIGIYAYEVRQNRTLDGVLAETDKRVTSQREQSIRFSKEFSDKGASKALAEDLVRTEERLQRREELLGEIKTGVGGDTEGYSRFLGALARQRTQGVWLTGVEIGTKQTGDVVIRGRALESRMVPAYIRALNREAPFAGRAVGELRMSAKSEASKDGPDRYIEFLLSIPLRESAAPVPAAKGSS